MIRILRRALIVCACAGSLTLGCPVFGQNYKTASAEQTAPAEKKTKRKVYKGTIETIDAANATVTVKKATTSKTFKVAENARFATSDNKNASLAPLQPGDVVNVRFTEEGDMAIAHHIAQTRKKAKGTAGAQ